MTDDEYLHGNLDKAKRSEAEERLTNAKDEGLPIEMIIAGYGKRERIFLYSDGLHISEHSSPGIFVAGSGSGPAQDWLNFRKQNVHDSWELSYYHMLEAMRFAELSRGVGENKNVVMLGIDGFVLPLHKSINPENERISGFLFNEYWLRDTSAHTAEIEKLICGANAMEYRKYA